jgi:hypothetical protein
MIIPVLPLLAAVYFASPILAGASASLSVVRPSSYVYSQDVWHGWYVIGWEWAGREGKPRFPVPEDIMKRLQADN